MMPHLLNSIEQNMKKPLMENLIFFALFFFQILKKVMLAQQISPMNKKSYFRSLIFLTC